ncbi:MAG: HAD family hydrolase, partial [Phycisphaerae bacterium]
VRVLSGDTGERIERLRGKRGTSPLASGRAVCVEGGLTPQEKLDRVNALKAEGRRVLFVGDGINDAAAMAAADVGIATAEGSALAGETAQIVWAGLADGPRDVRAIVQAISVCRQTVATLRGNLRIAAAYNAVGMSVAAAGWLHPVFAVVVMLASSLLVTLRAGGLQDDAPGEGLYRDGPVAGGVAGVSPPAVRAPALASAGASSGEM